MRKVRKVLAHTKDIEALQLRNQGESEQIGLKGFPLSLFVLDHTLFE